MKEIACALNSEGRDAKPHEYVLEIQEEKAFFCCGPKLD
jgi:hypothetical protein